MGKGTSRDLEAWTTAMDLAESACRVSRKLPEHERFGLMSPIRRAGASIPANIAEGYGRDSAGDLVRFLRMAQGGTKELEAHALLAVRVGLLREEEIASVMEIFGRSGRITRGLIRWLGQREPS